MNDLGARLNLKDISTQFISVAVAMNALVDSICDMTNKEVSETTLSRSSIALPQIPEPSFLTAGRLGRLVVRNTLFRGNTVLTKVRVTNGCSVSLGLLILNTIQTVELFMAWYGKPFLESSVGDVIRRISLERVSIEVDPTKTSQPTWDLEKNVDTLVYWCKELWDSIYRVRSECPPEMRRLFEHIRRLVEKRCRAMKTPPDDGCQNDIPWQAVSAFIFLRFTVPAILHPHLFGLVPGKLFFRSLSLVKT